MSCFVDMESKIIPAKAWWTKPKQNLYKYKYKYMYKYIYKYKYKNYVNIILLSGYVRWRVGLWLTPNDD